MQHEGEIRAFIGSMLRDRTLCDDTFQEVALTLWEQADRYEASRPFGPWARGIAANKVLERRRLRRALTEEELVKLLDAARRRPLHEAMLIRRGKRKGQAIAKVRASVREELEALGRERALVYAALATTGLRKGKLASLTVGQAFLDSARPYLRLCAANAKSRREALLPLRRDVAHEIGLWLNDRLETRQRAARDAGEPIPAALPPDEPLFRVPAALVKILRRDLEFAGISTKRDAQGRKLDVHCLRVSFSTLLTKAGAAPRVAQAALRHSTINLAMNVYTDESLLPVAETIEALPVTLYSAYSEQEPLQKPEVGCARLSECSPLLGLP